ncbi:hypothetical protein Tco_1083939, partial [Tanacetum coccineum]
MGCYCQWRSRRRAYQLEKHLLLLLLKTALNNWHAIWFLEEAFKSRFEVMKNPRRCRKNVLKHQFENFSTASNESLDKAYDRFQKLISQLEVHGAPISKEDINQKSGRNHGRRYYGDNGRSNAPTNESSSQALVAQDGLGGYDWSNDFEVEPVNYALMAISSSSSSSSSNKVVQNCSKQCLESFKTLQKNFHSEREKHSKARLEIQGYELALESLESRILVHEKNELAWGEKYEFQNYELKCREIKINNLNLELEKVVKERGELKLKIEKWVESSKNLCRSSDEEITPANDRFSKEDGYHAVPPLITGNFLTPRADISFAGLDGYAIRKKIIESKKTELNTKPSETVGALTRTGLITPIKKNKKRAVHKVSTARLVSTAMPVSIARPVSTARPVSIIRPFAPKIAQTSGVIRPIYPRMNNVRPRGSYSPIKRFYYTKPAFRPKYLKQDVKTFRIQNITTAGTRAVVNTGKGKMDTDLKKSKGNPEILLQDHAVVDSGCSSHMTGNKAYLSDYEDYNGGFVAFESDPRGGKIMGKGKIRTANLDFDDVYFVHELKFNLFSVSQMCDKKNSVLFTETECLILSPSFKLLNESQVVLRAPRKDDVYSLDLKNIIPS